MLRVLFVLVCLSRGLSCRQPKPHRAPKGQSNGSGNGGSKGLLEFGSPLRRCTDGLLVLNGLLFVLQWASKDALMLWGAKVNSLIAAGQLWRLLTSSFLHTSAFHLLVRPQGATGQHRQPRQCMRRCCSHASGSM